jgi:pentalenic acid synthase
MTETQQAAGEQLMEFPMRRGCPYHPPAEYTELRNTYRETGKLPRVRMYDGRVAWIVTSFDEARELFADNQRLSVSRDNPNFPIPAERDGQFPDFFRQIAGLDGEPHHVRRRMLLPRFTLKQVAKLRPGIQRVTDELLDRMIEAGPPTDLINALARPLPSRVISQMLGVPYDDHEQFEEWSQGVMEAPTLELAIEHGQQLLAYLDTVIQAKDDKPEDDLLSTLVVEQLRTGAMTRDDLCKLTLAVLVAGHETTTSMIALGTLTLLENPDQLAAVRADPAAVPGAVEELLRYLSIADLTTIRVATADLTVNGQLIKEGDGVILSQAAANRDPEAFADPDVFDVRRADRRHLGFGHGVHRCVGEHLARAELEIVLGSLFARIPTLRMAVPVDEVPVKFNMTLEGVHELPVTW